MYLSGWPFSMKNGLTECDAGDSFGSSMGTSRNIPAHSGLTVTNGSLNSAVADCGYEKRWFTYWRSVSETSSSQRSSSKFLLISFHSSFFIHLHFYWIYSWCNSIQFKLQDQTLAFHKNMENIRVHFQNISLDLRICRPNPKVVLSRLVSRRLFLTGFLLLSDLVAPFGTLIGLLLRRPCIADQIGCSIEGENLYF